MNQQEEGGNKKKKKRGAYRKHIDLRGTCRRELCKSIKEYTPEDKWIGKSCSLDDAPDRALPKWRAVLDAVHSMELINGTCIFVGLKGRQFISEVKLTLKGMSRPKESLNEPVSDNKLRIVRVESDVVQEDIHSEMLESDVDPVERAKVFA